MLSRQLLHNSVEICIRLRMCYARLQSSQYPNIAGIPRMQPIRTWLDLRCHAHRNPVIAADDQLGSEKTARRDANHCKRIAVDLYHSSNHIGIGCKATLPKTMTYYDDRVCAWFIVFVRTKKTSQVRLDSKRFKVVPGCFVAPSQAVFPRMQADVHEIDAISN